MEAGEAADAEMVPEYSREAGLPSRAMKGGRKDLVAGKAGPRDATPKPAPAAPAPATPSVSRTAAEPAIAHPADAPTSIGADEDAFGGVGMGRRVGKEADVIEVQPPRNGRPRKDQLRYAVKKEAGAEAVGREPSAGGKAGQPRPEGQRPEPALIVQCLATPEALREQTFERLLKEQGIRRIATAEADARGDLARVRALQLGPVESYAVRARPPGLPQVVEVEATRDQLKGLLLSVQGQPDQFAFLDAAPRRARPAVNGRRFRAGLDRAQRYEAANVAEEMAVEPVQQKSRGTEVDELLRLLEGGAAGDPMRRKAGVGVLEEARRPAADSAAPLPSAPADIAPSMPQTQQLQQPKAGPPAAFGAAGPARPSAAGGLGLAGQSAAPAEMPPPSEVPAPMEPAPERPLAEMEIQAEQRPANEEELQAREWPEVPGGQPSRPKPVPEEEGEKRFAEAKKAKQPAPTLPAEQPDRYVRTYRVRFEFHAVDRPGVAAASIAQEAAAARMAEEPPMALDAAEAPAAAAAPAAEEQP
jgi:hypothetical protein